ncbi:hypothetical protein HDC37_000962 [Microbacterium sp. AK009]|nr:hypothetical protein [Microbacterium sp. AK009]
MARNRLTAVMKVVGLTAAKFVGVALAALRTSASPGGTSPMPPAPPPGRGVRDYRP